MIDSPLTGRDRYRWVDPFPPSASVDYWIEEMTAGGEVTIHGPARLPELRDGPRLQLAAARPNPFSARTTASVQIGRPGYVRATIVDVLGRAVITLQDGVMEAGTHALSWSGLTADGGPARSGIYFLTVTAGQETRTRKIVVARCNR